MRELKQRAPGCCRQQHQSNPDQIGKQQMRKLQPGGRVQQQIRNACDQLNEHQRN
jgi:hypothetical protein